MGTPRACEQGTQAREFVQIIGDGTDPGPRRCRRQESRCSKRRVRAGVRIIVQAHAQLLAVREELADELAHGAGAHDAPVLHDGHAVGQRLGLVQVVRGEEHGHGASAQAVQHLVHLAARARVETDGGLVEEQQLRGMERAGRDIHAPLHAARQRSHRIFRAVREAGPRERSGNGPRQG